MSPDGLHCFLKSRFGEVFGEPDRGLGCEAQWSLKPFSGASSVNVVISGSHHQAVWLFDPHTPRDPIHRWPVVHSDQVEVIIALILERLGKVVGSRVPSPLSTVPALQRQQWDRGALDLLHAVKYSLPLALGEQSFESTTARRQRLVRDAASTNTPPRNHVEGRDLL